MVRIVDMASFWDARARENALFYVDNTLKYGRPDQQRFWRDGEAALENILETLGVELSADDDVVEIGCGVGRLTRALAAQARSVVALDVSAEMLARAREWNPDAANVRWVHGDGASLAGIDDASADLCFSHVTFQHLPDPAITLGYVREMGRVLRVGGIAAFQISNDPRLHHRASRWGRFTHRLRAVAGPRGQDHPAWRGSSVELEDLGTAASAGGLAVERVDGAGTQFCLVALRRLD